mmetsp:Transcript_3423/g.5892  ORF Transcript_3423/g.5892 Transcript_3423/m.5892 type:complete len:234 (-) Transcript_3423:8023-8724(-)
MAVQGTETSRTLAGWNLSSLMYGSIFLIKASWMFSLSKVSMKFTNSSAFPSSCRLGSHQSSTFFPTSPTFLGWTPFILHTTSITYFTPPGGFAYLPTSATSFAFKFFSTFKAASSAGRASSSTLSACVLIPLHSSALPEATASSFNATSFFSLASFLSISIWAIITLISSWVLIKMGWDSLRVFCRTSIPSSVVASFSSPLTSRIFCPITISRFFISRAAKISKTDKKEVGVT